jgi:hypothetical protein
MSGGSSSPTQAPEQPGAIRHGLAVIGTVSYLLAPQVPYLLDGAVEARLAVVLTVAVGAGLGWLGIRTIGRPVAPAGLTVWFLLASGLWVPVAVPQWKAALAPLAATLTAITVIGIAVALRQIDGGTPARSNRWTFVALASGVLIVAEVGRRLFGGEGVHLGWGLFWALLVVTAVVGWGRLIAPITMGSPRPDWGLSGALGLASACLFTGITNLTWTTSPLVVELFLALGTASWAVDLIDDRSPERPSHRRSALHPAIAAVIVVAVGLQLAGAVAGTIDTVYRRPAIDRHDDAQAYMVFPRSMLETGSIGPQPWEARRMLSPGAQSGLQTLVLAGNPVRAVHLMDAGVAVVLLVGLVLGAARHRELGGWATALVLVVVLTANHIAMRGNTSAVVTGVVLLFALFRALDETDDSPGWGGIALLASASVAVKSTFAPAVVAMVGFAVLASFFDRDRRRGALLDVVRVGGVATVALLPWMISVLESSATLLYPVFGRGFFGGVFHDFSWAEGTFEVSPTARLRLLARHSVVLLPVLTLLFAGYDRRPRRAAVAVTAAAIVTLVALVFMGDPRLNRSLARYAFPPVLAATLGLLCTALVSGSTRRRRTGVAIAAAVAFLLVFGRPASVFDLYHQLARNIVDATSSPAAATPEEQLAAGAIQHSVPYGAMVLTTLEQPWLLDPTLIRLRVNSLPGWSSPPPGIHLDRGPEDLAATLEAQGVRYLAYGGQRDLHDLLGLTEKHIRERYRSSKMRWAILRGHERYRELVNRLADSRKRLYDDGRRVVLDLAIPASSADPATDPDRCQGFLEDGWTDGEATIRGFEAPAAPAFVILRTPGRHPAWRDPDPDAVSLVVEGHHAPSIASGPDFRVYRLDQPPEGRFSIDLRSWTVTPGEIGANPSGPSLGVDVTMVEVVADPELALQSIRTIHQHLQGDVTPYSVWRRNGFYRDNGWTNGNGSLEGLHWPVESGDTTLELELNPSHPEARQPELLDIRVTLDGLELEPLEYAPRIVRFRLPHVLDHISSVRIRSSTYVPRERGRSNDGRTLGVPVRRLSLLSE